MLTAKSPERCEMNRTFVTDAARGTGLGRALWVAVMERARELGFAQTMLDMLRVLEPAISLYRAGGRRTTTRPAASTPTTLRF